MSRPERVKSGMKLEQLLVEYNYLLSVSTFVLVWVCELTRVALWACHCCKRVVNIVVVLLPFGL